MTALWSAPQVFEQGNQPVLYDNSSPRYLPHMAHPEVLLMGLSPMAAKQWIETDKDLERYHQHKLQQREELGDRVYRATETSLPAQQELAALLLNHLCAQQPELYRQEHEQLHCTAAKFRTPIDSEEPLWNCSLWIADDLVLMEEIDGDYCMSAASLCSPSHWRLEEKFGRSMRSIHDPIPHFHEQLTPRIDRFFGHLRPEHPVVRFNWSLQEHDALNQRPEHAGPVCADTELFYRTERQTLLRLPQTGAIAFTIRVYLHPLSSLASVPGALPALFAAIDATPQALAKYKGFDELAQPLARYRIQA